MNRNGLTAVSRILKEMKDAADQAAATKWKELEQNGGLIHGNGIAWIRIRDRRKVFFRVLLGEKEEIEKKFRVRVEQNGVISLRLGPMCVWVQEAACEAAAEVLQHYGIDCYSESSCD